MSINCDKVAPGASLKEDTKFVYFFQNVSLRGRTDLSAEAEARMHVMLLAKMSRQVSFSLMLQI
jgi:hypothetical protein